MAAATSATWAVCPPPVSGDPSMGGGLLRRPANLTPAGWSALRAYGIRTGQQRTTLDKP